MGSNRASPHPGPSPLSPWLEPVVVYDLHLQLTAYLVTIRHYWPERAGKIAQYEQTFGVTVSRKKKIDVIDLGSAVAPIQISDVEALEQVSREDYTLPIFVPEGQKWVLPGGAFGREACGSD